MSNVHPHWEAEGEEVPVRVRAETSGEASVPENAKTISRQPAAIVGMLTVIAIGYIFVQGVDSLTGQVSDENNSNIVLITEEGLVPSTLEVEHGETITWTNQQSIPHILESMTLCSDTGFCLQTKTLFEGESDNFTITLDMPAGTYDYTSATSESIQGQIIITTTAAPDFQEISSLLDDDFFGNSPSNNPQPVDSPFDVPQPSPAQQNTFAPVDTQPGIPRNPYTADSARVHPFDGEGNPIESAFDSVPTNTPTVAPRVPSNGRGPVRQPETGAGGLWFIIAGSIVALWYLTRNSFSKATQF